MILDSLENTRLYTSLHTGITKALAWLQATDLIALAPGRYFIEREDVFAIVQEYETVDAVKELMEAHKKYIDVQYMIKGAEMVGISLLKDQRISKPYETETDFLLFQDPPDFFAKLSEGNFMIFYPTDLLMPSISVSESLPVKKVVVKVSIRN